MKPVRMIDDMGRQRRLLGLLLILFACSMGWSAEVGSEGYAEALFARRVLPILQEKCLACHGRDEAKIKGGLDLRTLEETLFGGDSGKPAIVPSKPEESPLYLASTRKHDDWEAMPPKENDALSTVQLDYLKTWIEAGAPWPNEARLKELLKQDDQWSVADGVQVKTSGGLAEDWTNRRYKPEDLWAYQPLKKPAAPASTAGKNPVDAFLEAKQRQTGLVAAPPADRRTLIRRATFDLTGLPPKPEEIAAFVGDAAPDAQAFEKVVDRLLASPHYGEQWARHWLDVVRYADSSGLANDFVRGSSWRYRDYVVRAFNDDKPYDAFIREQIAGDELASHADQRTAEALVATGFLRMGPWELTSMEVPRVARQKFLDDVTDSVGQVFLAHPLQCAKCHDHKFDPIPTKDYYSFQAIFATTQLADRPAPFLPFENTGGFEEKKYLLQRQEFYREQLRSLNAKQIAGARAWLAENKIDPAAFEEIVAGIRGKKGDGLRDFGQVRAQLERRKVAEAQIPPKGVGFTPEDFGLERIARKGLERIRWELDRYEPVAFSVYSGRTPQMTAVLSPLRLPKNPHTEGELEASTILTGGDPFANGAPVTPAVLSAATYLGGMGVEPNEVPAEIEGRRRALAEWITSPKNPLTARVLVNRIWSWHFGQAIAGNPNNFGATGKKPTHPELLDWLAATFLEGHHGGPANSIKALHRVILNSEAYRRSSSHPDPKSLAEKDPTGISYAVFKPRRLAAEELRDAMLAVSGELNPALGGIPARPEINLEAALQPRQVMGTFAEAWQPAPKPEQRHRRSLYVMKIRGLLDPFMEVFNAPSPDLSCEARDASTVTPQVFSLFNSVATLDRALAFAARLQKETNSLNTAIDRAFWLAFGRQPSGKEASAARAHVDRMLVRHRTLQVPDTPPPREVVREAVEENTGEKFTFTEPLEATADFVPDLKPSQAAPETRALAELCLVLYNSNEFAYLY